MGRPPELTGEDKREAFRIDDSLPVMIHAVEDLESSSAEELDLADWEELSLSDAQGENLNPLLRKMLIAMNKKLDRVLERLPVDLVKVKAQPINLSSAGIRVVDKKKFKPEQEVRIKMLLPTLPVQEILVSGKVVRVASLKNGQYEVAFRFHDLDEEVKDEIIQFILKQQRKAIMARRQQRETDGS
ncbi:MAG: PilZ domain-containing protein [Deltaproteobacteria bacterium]|nr:PilZ domain-containing protein [Deltaproteobacteria bacterium]